MNVLKGYSNLKLALLTYERKLLVTLIRAIGRESRLRYIGGRDNFILL